MPGFYCQFCGEVQPLPNGVVTCRMCGGAGLHGFDNRKPVRAECPVEDCKEFVWDDGGVNPGELQHRYKHRGQRTDALERAR